MKMEERVIKKFKITSKLGEELINSILYILRHFQEENPNTDSIDINFIPFKKYFDKEISHYLQDLRKLNFEYLGKIKENLKIKSNVREQKIEKFIVNFREKTNRILSKNNLSEPQFKEFKILTEENKIRKENIISKILTKNSNFNKKSQISDLSQCCFEIQKIRIKDHSKAPIAKFMALYDEKNILIGGVKTELMKLKLGKDATKTDIEIFSDKIEITDMVYLKEAECGFLFNSEKNMIQKFTKNFEILENFNCNFDINFGKKIKKFGGKKKIIMVNLGNCEVLILSNITKKTQNLAKLSEIPGGDIIDFSGSNFLKGYCIFSFISKSGILTFYSLDENFRYKKTQSLELELSTGEECIAVEMAKEGDYCAVTSFSANKNSEFSAKLFLFQKINENFSKIYTLKFPRNLTTEFLYCFYLINMSFRLEDNTPLILLSQFSAPYKLFSFCLNEENKLVEFINPFIFNEEKSYKILEENGKLWSIDSSGNINILKFKGDFDGELINKR